MSSRRVVVTGIGLATPVGIGAENVWNALVEGKCGVRRLTAFDPSGFESQIGGEIGSLVMKNYVPRSYLKSTRVMARDIEIAVAAAYEAAKDAGLKTKCLIERGEVQVGPRISVWVAPKWGSTRRAVRCAALRGRGSDIPLPTARCP